MAKKLKSKTLFSKSHLSVFLIIFAVIGTILLIKTLAAPNPALPGDLNNDNTVNISDLSILLSNYNTSNSTADINGDGTVNILDMSILLSHYGQTITAAVPSVPTGLSATPGDGTVALKWTANPSSESVDKYQLYWGTDSTLASFTFVDNITTASYNLSGLSNGTTYYFRLSAHNASGYGAWGSIVSAMPQSSTGGGGGGGGSTSGVAAPIAPSAYTVPSGAELVTNSYQLITALGKAQHDIVLANGTYDNSSAFSNGNSNRIYAQNLGGATLTAGLSFSGSGPGNGLVQGVVFNMTSTSKEAGGFGAIFTSGASGANTRIYDCVLKGNKVISMGIAGYNPSGLDVQRDQFYDFVDVGIRASNNVKVNYSSTNAGTPIIKAISDIYVNGVTYPTPGGSNGTAEAGVWVGHPVANGVHRIKTRNVSWSGLETVNNSWNTTFTDLDIDMSGANESDGVAVYMEHFTMHDTFSNFIIVGANVGFNSEWDDGVAGNAGGHFNVIQNGTIDATGAKRASHTAGVFLDEGTDSTTVTGVTFKNQTWAGIGYYKNIGTNSFTNNTYQLAPGAVNTTTNHI
jgi:hypothetical protein